MPVRQGSTAFAAIKYGSADISAIYEGTLQVWPEGGVLRADPLSVAITFNNATLYAGWLEADTLATAITFNDATLSLTGALLADTLQVAVTFNDATMFGGWLEAGTLAAAITLHDATLELDGDLILLSGDAQSGSDAIDFSGDEAPGSLKVSGS